MQHDALDDAMAMKGVDQPNASSNSDFIDPFRSIDTSRRLPHAAHEHRKSSLDDEDQSFDSGAMQLHPTHDFDDSFNTAQSRSAIDGSKHMSLLDAMSLTIGLQVGSGIFSSPGVVTADVGSLGASVLVWIASGALTLTGASSYAELATAIPMNGGAQAYLQYSYGSLTSFLFSWTAIVALKSSSAAIIATILGEYLVRVVLHLVNDSTSDDFQKFQVGELPRFAVKLVAAGAVLSICLVQTYSARMGVRVQNSVTAIKVLLLSAIPLIAIVYVSQGRMPDASRVSFGSVASFFRDSSILPSQYALALYSGLWAFDGWDQVSYIAGEMRNPRRDVPIAVHASTLIVSSGFVVVVLSYFLVLPPLTVARTNSIALDFGAAVFGSVGGVMFAGFVAFSCLGALNGHMYTYSRLAMAAGRDSFLPSAVGKVNAKSGTPVMATILCTSLVLLFVVLGTSFASLVNFCGVCAWFWYGLTVSSLLYLRVKEPNLHRPYETWLITPILFISIALFLLIMPIFAAPYEALAAMLFIAAGIPIYYVSQSRNWSTLHSWFPARSHDFTAVPTDVDDIQLESSSYTPSS
ncbi:hypothetical protein MPSI1_002682 [Malassezia psittaci]|uniref:Amino acid transporter n=1 Tax=Malassezia psittaci TaxID=1821823 RepID=A0AAF0FGB3_9BASI|nr:hypothetical protein MPSI1_002682 [Malassezia psittaci]